MRATLFREPLDARVAPAGAALILRGDERPFALLGAWAGGGAVLGSEPARVAGPGEDLFAVLDEVPDVAEPAAAALAVGGGWFGFFGFEARHRVERGHPPPPRPVPLADGALAYYDHVLRMDADGRWWFEALVTAGREAVIGAARRSSRRGWPRRRRRGRSRRATGLDPSPAGHAEAVEECRERIAAGDLFQANLCMRLDGRLEATRSTCRRRRRGAADQPRRLCRRSLGDGREPFAGGVPHPRRPHRRSAPIKGTRPPAPAQSSPARRRTAPRT